MMISKQSIAYVRLIEFRYTNIKNYLHDHPIRPHCIDIFWNTLVQNSIMINSDLITMFQSFTVYHINKILIMSILFDTWK